uniref:Uncharacterized protein n=1 Tax=Salix viminalis TaxID=40686 RepID=A0A6N2MX75_SALVM
MKGANCIDKTNSESTTVTIVLIHERIPSPSFHHLEDSIRSSKAYSLSVKQNTKPSKLFNLVLH